MVSEATKQGYAIVTEGDSNNLEHPNLETRRGRVGKGVAQTLTTSCNQGVNWGGMQNNQSIKTDGICTCLTSSMGCGGGYVPMDNINQGMRTEN